MQRKFVLPVKPFSINSLHYRDGKRKTVEAREWEVSVFHEMSRPEIIKALDELHTAFDYTKHAFVVRMTCYYPEEIFYTKQGTVSGRTMDQSNWEKPLIDLLFLEKYASLQPPFGAPNLRIDDKYIVSLTSRKKPHPLSSHKIEISIRIISNKAQNHTTHSEV